MPMEYDPEQHGPLHWPMPFPGVWLPQDDKPGCETYWRLQDAQLHATSYARNVDVDVFAPFVTDKGTEVVWLDVVGGRQRLFRLAGGGVLAPLDHWRVKP